VVPPSVGRAEQGRAHGGGAGHAFPPGGPAVGVASPWGGRATVEPRPHHPTRPAADLRAPAPPDRGPGFGAAPRALSHFSVNRLGC